MTGDLSASAIEAALVGRFGTPLKFFDEIGSTNTEAQQWAETGAPEGALVVANHQTAGRGRWGRSWFSKPGTLLQFSLILRPEMPVDHLGLLTTALGVACAEAIETLTSVPIRLKWPNDVLVRGRKLAGILVESRVEGARIEAAIAGIGINVSWQQGDAPEEIAQRATSLAIETDGELPDRSRLLAAILAEFEKVYAAARDPNRASTVIAAASARSEVLGRRVTVRFADGSTKEGMAQELLPNGALRLATEGSSDELHVAEIEQIREVEEGSERC